MTAHRAMLELAKRLTKVEQDVAARNQPQLAASSVENGAITHYDGAGQLTAVMGAQHDGTTAPTITAGPTPPPPTGLDAVAGQLTATATWAGTFSGDVVAPMDFARIEVHRGYTADFTVDTLPTSATRVGTIEAPGGGSFTWSEEPGDVWVTIVTRAQSGKASDSQEVVQVTVFGAVDPEEFDQLNADLKASAQNIVTAQAAADAAADEAKNGQIDGARIIDGTLVADRVIVPGTVGATMIADGAITSPKIAVNSIDASKIIAASISGDRLIANTITGDKIAANTITADYINAASVGAAVGDFTFIKADNVLSGQITASIGIATTGEVVAGDQTKSYARMDSQGFTTWLVAPDGTQILGTALGSGGANALTIADSDGDVTGAISPDGTASLSDLDVDQDPSFMGRPLLGKRVDPNADDGILDDGPRGPVGFGDLRSQISGVTLTSSGGTTPTALAVVGFTMYPSRAYRISMPIRYDVSSITSGKVARVGILTNYTYATGDSANPDEPSSSNTRVNDTMTAYPSAVSGVSGMLNFVWRSPFSSATTVKFLVSLVVDSCTVAPSTYGAFDWQITVEDIGPEIDSTSRALDVASSGKTTASGQTTSAPPPKKVYTATWYGDASKEYTGAGNETPSRVSGGYIRMGNAGGGNLRSAISFNSASVDGEKKTMSSALSGASITKAEVFVKFKMWYTSSGGWGVVRPLSGSSLPSTLTDGAIPSARVSKQYTAANQGYWIQVPTSWFSTSNRGVIVGPATDNNASSYGYYCGPSTANSDRIKLRLTYTR